MSAMSRTSKKPSALRPSGARGAPAWVACSFHGDWRLCGDAQRIYRIRAPESCCCKLSQDPLRKNDSSNVFDSHFNNCERIYYPEACSPSPNTWTLLSLPRMGESSHKHRRQHEANFAWGKGGERGRVEERVGEKGIPWLEN